MGLFFRAPKCESYRNGDIGRFLGQEARRESLGVADDILERVAFLCLDVEFPFQSFHQTLRVGRSSTYQHPIYSFHGTGALEEVKCLLDFQRNDFGYRLDDMLSVRGRDTLHGLTVLDRLSLCKTQVELLLYEIGILMARDADIACEEKVA